MKDLKGVHSARPGYAGGHVERPTYEQVCGKRTGHAEVVEFEYDAAVIDHGTLLRVFFTAHDPTQMNRQGNDVGPQYRSIVFVNGEEERASLETVLQDVSTWYDDAIVTEIEDLNAHPFWTAEAIHHDYFANNPQNRIAASWWPRRSTRCGPSTQRCSSADQHRLVNLRATSSRLSCRASSPFFSMVERPTTSHPRKRNWLRIAVMMYSPPPPEEVAKATGRPLNRARKSCQRVESQVMALTKVGGVEPLYSGAHTNQPSAASKRDHSASKSSGAPCSLEWDVVKIGKSMPPVQSRRRRDRRLPAPPQSVGQGQGFGRWLRR